MAPGSAAAPLRTGEVAAVPPRPGRDAAAEPFRLVPLRPLGLGEVLDGAVDAIRRNPRTTLVFGAALIAAQQALSVPVQYLAQDLALAPGGADDPAALLAELLALSASTAAIVVLSVVLAGAMAVVVAAATTGRDATIGAVWARVQPRFWALAGLGCAVAAATVLGLAAFGLGAVFVFVVTAVAAPVLVLEGTGIRAAFRRSWQLTIRDFWRVLAVRAVALVVSSVLTFVLGLPFMLGALLLGGGPFSPAGLGALSLTALGALAGGTVAGPFAGCVDALLYTDRRMRAEGLDLDLAQRERLARTGAPA